MVQMVENTLRCKAEPSECRIGNLAGTVVELVLPATSGVDGGWSGCDGYWSQWERVSASP